MSADLRLVDRREHHADTAGTAPGRWSATGLAGLLAAVAVYCSLSGADQARRPSDASARSREALRTVVASGSEAPEVLEALRELRAHVGRRPLDRRARVAYASLLLGVSRRVADAEAAGFHAEVAVHQAPVTMPIVRAATLVLARCGRRDAAAKLVRGAFSHSPGESAVLLLRVEPFLHAEQFGDAIPDEPSAWVAIIYQLRRAGRAAEAERHLDNGLRRWPANLTLLELIAAQRVLARDWEGLDPVFGDRELPRSPEAARLWSYRSRYHAGRGRIDEARRDVEQALALDDRDPVALLLAGEALRDLERMAEARNLWNRALFAAAAQPELRARLMVNLARADDAAGRAAAALRLWREVLRLDADHDEARRRVVALGGG